MASQSDAKPGPSPWLLFGFNGFNSAKEALGTPGAWLLLVAGMVKMLGNAEMQNEFARKIFLLEALPRTRTGWSALAIGALVVFLWGWSHSILKRIIRSKDAMIEKQEKDIAWLRDHLPLAPEPPNLNLGE